MTKDELEGKIQAINLEPNTSAEEKSRRIAALNGFHSEQQRKQADIADRKRQAAEADLKSNLRSAYMADPVATAEDFERDYPVLRSEHLRTAALKANDQAREASFQAARATF